MLTFLSSVCSVTRSSSFRGRLRKHWKGVVRFISPLLVHFKLSNSCQQKYGVIVRKVVLCNTDWVNLWMNLWKVCHKTTLLRIRKHFKWGYANPWSSLVGIRYAYHVDYTTVQISENENLVTQAAADVIEGILGWGMGEGWSWIMMKSHHVDHFTYG